MNFNKFGQTEPPIKTKHQNMKYTKNKHFFLPPIKKVPISWRNICPYVSLCPWQCEYTGEYSSYWPSPFPAVPLTPMRMLKTSTIQPPLKEASNAKTLGLTLEATVSLFKSRTQLHSFPLHRGGCKWSRACFTLLSTAQQWCEIATAIHSPGRLVCLHFFFSSPCRRCLTLATDISCPGRHQVQDIKQCQQQYPLCLKPSKDPDTILFTGQIKKSLLSVSH